jgi:hypothetical protein
LKQKGKRRKINKVKDVGRVKKKKKKGKRKEEEMNLGETTRVRFR